MRVRVAFMGDDLVAQRQPISAEPTKAFFVEMLTRDIPLEQAVMDLVDNSVDGAKRFQELPSDTFLGRWVKVDFDSDHFAIVDNCGGFGEDEATRYAFRFGRAKDAKLTPNSIGQFGVGMKRALFKFGRHFKVQSRTSEDEWAVDVDVDEWELYDDWKFPWGEFDSNALPTDFQGTRIDVTSLRPEVRARFKTKRFEALVSELVRTKHRQFISQGLSVEINGRAVEASTITVKSDTKVIPGVRTLTDETDGAEVAIKIIVGLGDSKPREAGWYVICNGRVVLEADRRMETGWGLVEERMGGVFIPRFHNQFARFRGVVFFSSVDSSRVPWNTTKTDVDVDSAVWQRAFGVMTEMMRPAVDFLNNLDEDIDNVSREESVMLKVIEEAKSVPVDALFPASDFDVSATATVVEEVKSVRIQYVRPKAEVEILQDVLGVKTARAVGEKAFELVLEQYG